MVDRNIREGITNKLLLLYTIGQTNKQGRMENPLKLQKLVFLVQKKLIERKLKGFSYNFFRWFKGPYSAEVSMDLDLLVGGGLVNIHEDKIKLAPDGKEVVHSFRELLRGGRNQPLMGCIDSILKEHAAMDPEALKDKVYAIKVMVPRIRKLMTIQEIPSRQLILFKSSDEKVRQIFEIDEARQGLLELVFDAEALELLKKAQADTREGRVREFRAL